MVLEVSMRKLKYVDAFDQLEIRKKAKAPIPRPPKEIKPITPYVETDGYKLYAPIKSG